MPNSDARSISILDLVFAQLLDRRTVVIGSEVDDTIASRVASQLLLLASYDPTSDIRLYIDSPGGSPSSALAIHDAINFVSCDVSTWAVGRVGSVSNLILSSGSKGKRYAISTSFMALDCSPDFRRHADSASHDSLLAEVVGLMARLTGQSIDQAAIDLRASRTLTATAARDYGLVDLVVETAPGGPQSN